MARSQTDINKAKQTHTNKCRSYRNKDKVFHVGPQNKLHKFRIEDVY